MERFRRNPKYCLRPERAFKLKCHFNLNEKDEKDVGSGGVICLTDTVYPIDGKNSFIPVWLI